MEASEDLDSPEDLEAIRLFERRRSQGEEGGAPRLVLLERRPSGASRRSKPEPPAFKNGMIAPLPRVTSFEWMVGQTPATWVILGDEMGLHKSGDVHLCHAEHVRTRTPLRCAPRPFLRRRAPHRLVPLETRDGEVDGDVCVVVLVRETPRIDPNNTVLRFTSTMGADRRDRPSSTSASSPSRRRDDSPISSRSLSGRSASSTRRINSRMSTRRPPRR